MGFCEMPQISRKFAIKKPTNYRVINRLIQINLVRYERLSYRHHGTYYLTRKGASYTDLPAIDKIPLGNYHHQIMLTDVYLKLSELYQHIKWISERRLKFEKFNSGQFDKSGHVSDGILVFPDGKQVAIEVELTMKAKDRLQQIFSEYGTQLDINEVWYFCNESIYLNVAQ